MAKKTRKPIHPSVYSSLFGVDCFAAVDELAAAARADGNLAPLAAYLAPGLLALAAREARRLLPGREYMHEDCAGEAVLHLVAKLGAKLAQYDPAAQAAGEWRLLQFLGAALQYEIRSAAKKAGSLVGGEATSLDATHGVLTLHEKDYEKYTAVPGDRRLAPSCVREELHADAKVVRWLGEARAELETLDGNLPAHTKARRLDAIVRRLRHHGLDVATEAYLRHELGRRAAKAELLAAIDDALFEAAVRARQPRHVAGFHDVASDMVAA